MTRAAVSACHSIKQIDRVAIDKKAEEVLELSDPDYTLGHNIHELSAECGAIVRDNGARGLDVGENQKTCQCPVSGPRQPHGNV